MAYWLLKTEPDEWSWDDQVRAGTDVWDGVTNPQAVQNLKRMKRGDLALFYHTGGQRSIVGIVEVVREAHPDPNDRAGRRVVVTVRAVRQLPRPVARDEIKTDPTLAHLALVRQPRLSVVPLDAGSWKRILEIASGKSP